MNGGVDAANPDSLTALLI